MFRMGDANMLDSPSATLKETIDCRRPFAHLNCDNVYQFILHEKDKLERVSLTEKMYMIICYSLFNEANIDNIKFPFAFITYQLADMLGYDKAKQGCVMPMTPFKLREKKKLWDTICLRAGLKQL